MVGELAWSTLSCGPIPATTRFTNIFPGGFRTWEGGGPHPRSNPVKKNQSQHFSGTIKWPNFGNKSNNANVILMDFPYNNSSLSGLVSYHDPCFCTKKPEVKSCNINEACERRVEMIGCLPLMPCAAPTLDPCRCQGPGMGGKDVWSREKLDKKTLKMNGWKLKITQLKRIITFQTSMTLGSSR